jgi:hypothetical protein
MHCRFALPVSYNSLSVAPENPTLTLPEADFQVSADLIAQHLSPSYSKMAQGLRCENQAGCSL